MTPRPTPDDLIRAREKTIPDVIAPGLHVLFCGINPGLYSASLGQHFARPGNRFWPALFAGGFTPRLFRPEQQWDLLPLGLGITNVVDRASAAADELSSTELIAGAEKLKAKVQRYCPTVLAVLGVGAYRVGFGQRKAGVGLQALTVDKTRIWVLPNPSGLNAHYQSAALATAFVELHDFAMCNRYA